MKSKLWIFFDAVNSSMQNNIRTGSKSMLTHSVSVLYTGMGKTVNEDYTCENLKNCGSKICNYFFLSWPIKVKWRMKINSTKSQAVFFCKKRTPSPPVNFDSETIEFGKIVKFLGMHLNSTGKTYWLHYENFCKSKNDFAHLYANETSIKNKLLL